MATPNKPKAPAKPFAPAQAVMVSFGRWRVDGRDAKRMHRRFFTGPQAEANAKKHAAELNAAPRPGPAAPSAPAKPGAKLGGALRNVIDAHAGLEAKKAATAKAKLAAKAAPGQFAALHRETALKALNDLVPTSNRAAVVFAIRQAELAGLPQQQVESVLTAKGFGAPRLAGFTNQLKAETAKA
jgi:hypothetical protein